jgi:hypothetical protein
MLYILGGAARSGKSIITRRILAEKRIPFFCLDHLAIGAATTFPQLQIDLDSDDAQVGEIIWPLVKSMATLIIKDKIDYLLEGALIQPENANDLLSAFPSAVHACFVGYAEADIEEKFAQVRQFGGGPDDWMMQFDDATVRNELERLKLVSKVIREDCEKYQLQYFEISNDFGKSIEAVIEYLTT